jgi:hypothetical protein
VRSCSSDGEPNRAASSSRSASIAFSRASSSGCALDDCTPDLGDACDQPAVAVACVFVDDLYYLRQGVGCASRFRRGSCVARRPLRVNRSGHAIRARRSASSSQTFTARMTSSLGGIPFGNSALSRASRSAPVRERRRPSAVRRVRVPSGREPAVAVIAALRRTAPAFRRRGPAELVLLEAPTIPCA